MIVVNFFLSEKENLICFVIQRRIFYKCFSLKCCLLFGAFFSKTCDLAIVHISSNVSIYLVKLLPLRTAHNFKTTLKSSAQDFCVLLTAFVIMTSSSIFTILSILFSFISQNRYVLLLWSY